VTDIVTQLRSNADAHHEAEGTERRRAADVIEQQRGALAAAHATIERVREVAGEHWDWKSGRVLADRLRAALVAPEAVAAECCTECGADLRYPTAAHIVDCSDAPVSDAAEPVDETLLRKVADWAENECNGVAMVTFDDGVRLSVGIVAEGEPEEEEAFDSAVREAVNATLALRPAPSVEITDEMVEAGARALFEDPLSNPDYSWKQMAAEDPSRADLWRVDARRILTAALSPRVESTPDENGGGS
jgi:hypothetical protein